MKKVLGLLLLFAAPLSASAQTPSVNDSQPPQVADSQPPGLALAEPKWEDIPAVFTGFGDFGSSGGGGPSPHRTVNYNPPAHVARHIPANGLSWPSGTRWRSAGSNFFRAASVSLTNTGARAIKAVRLEFVFTDPLTGAEVLRLKHRTTKKLKPGVTRLIRKEARAKRRIRAADGADMGVEVTEVVYSDGTSWRRS